MITDIPYATTVISITDTSKNAAPVCVLTEDTSTTMASNIENPLVL